MEREGNFAQARSGSEFAVLYIFRKKFTIHYKCRNNLIYK